MWLSTCSMTSRRSGIVRIVSPVDCDLLTSLRSTPALSDRLIFAMGGGVELVTGGGAVSYTGACEKHVDL